MKRMEASSAGGSIGKRNYVPVRATTGTHCPFTGWWEWDKSAPVTVLYVWKGSIMPGLAGHGVEWHLAKADPAGQLAADMPEHAYSRVFPEDSQMPLWPDCQC